MQIARILFEILHLFAAHWLTILVAVAIVVACAGIDTYWIVRKYPHDTTGNGITIGQAKAFDNRSLALRVERLNAVLETLKVVN